MKSIQLKVSISGRTSQPPKKSTLASTRSAGSRLQVSLTTARCIKKFTRTNASRSSAAFLSKSTLNGANSFGSYRSHLTLMTKIKSSLINSCSFSRDSTSLYLTMRKRTCRTHSQEEMKELRRESQWLGSTIRSII